MVEGSLSSKAILDLGDVRANPAGYDWFEFRPNLKKLILAGAAETQHVALLWYTVPDGRVALHRHAQTESVYVIDGSQTDGKGTYGTGTVYFNPPGSGHELRHSYGVFLLAYAAPPDFEHTSATTEYTPVRIDTSDPALLSAAAQPPAGSGVRTLDIVLDGTGGMSSRLIELTSPQDRYEYVGNYVLVLSGTCRLPEGFLDRHTLAVAGGVRPEPFALTGGPCRLLGMSF